jgi:hypothetical protein
MTPINSNAELAIAVIWNNKIMVTNRDWLMVAMV